MITEKYIMERLRRYAKTPEGKAAIKETYGIDYKDVPYRRKMKAHGELMKSILYRHIAAHIYSLSMDDIIVGEPSIGKDGKASLKISFNEESLRRRSLLSDDYEDGVKDIVLLFTRGYHASAQVSGMWVHHGQSADTGVYISHSRQDRAPSDFLAAAVAEFNTRGDKFATAKLEDTYKTS